MLAETKKNYQNLADSQWVVTQWGDRAIRLVMDWLRRRKDNNWTLDQFMKHKHQMPNATSMLPIRRTSCSSAILSI